MSLRVTGVDNRLVNYKAKNHIINVFPSDASGQFDITNYDAYLYAKKYPIRPDSDLDVSIKYVQRDNSTGRFTFSLSPIISDISAGDYLYEVHINNRLSKYIVVQDKFVILPSLDTRYEYDPSIAASISSYEFNIIDSSIIFNIYSSNGLYWGLTFPSWITPTPVIGRGSSSIFLESDLLTLMKDGSIIIDNELQDLVIDVSFYYPDFEVDPESVTFDLDSSTINLNVFTDINNPWSYISKPDWINLSVENSYGDTSVNAYFNSSTYVDDGSLVFDSSYNLEEKVVDITFTKPSFLLNPTSISFNLDSSVLDFTISTHSLNKWGQISKTGTITTTVDEGQGSYSEKIFIDLDSIQEDCSLTYTSNFNNVVRQIDLVWDEPSAGLSLSEMTFSLDNQSIDVSTYTSSFNKWGLVSYPSWIISSKTSGTGNDKITFTFDSSTYVSDGSIQLDASYAGEFLIDVSFIEPSIFFNPESPVRWKLDDGLDISVYLDTNTLNTWSFIDTSANPFSILPEDSSGQGPRYINLRLDSLPSNKVDASFIVDSSYISTPTQLDVSFYEDIDVSPMIMSFSPFSDAVQTIDISTHSLNNWTIEFPWWVTYSSNSGSGNGTIDVSANYDVSSNYGPYDASVESNYSYPKYINMNYYYDVSIWATGYKEASTNGNLTYFLWEGDESGNGGGQFFSNIPIDSSLLVVGYPGEPGEGTRVSIYGIPTNAGGGGAGAGGGGKISLYGELDDLHNVSFENEIASFGSILSGNKGDDGNDGYKCVFVDPYWPYSTTERAIGGSGGDNGNGYTGENRYCSPGTSYNKTGGDGAGLAFWYQSQYNMYSGNIYDGISWDITGTPIEYGKGGRGGYSSFPYPPSDGNGGSSENNNIIILAFVTPNGWSLEDI